MDSSVWAAEDRGEQEKVWKDAISVGVVAIVFGSITPLPGSIIPILSGLVVLGVCIVLLLPVRDRTLVQILEGLVRGDKHGERKSGEIGQ